MSIKRPILAIVAAILLFLVYTWDVNRVEHNIMVGLQNQRVWYQRPQDALELTFDNEFGHIKLTRASASQPWQIVEPIEFPGNDAIVNAYLENARGAQRQARFPVENLAKYGLDHPKRSVTLHGTTEEGKTVTEKILFGSQPRDVSNVYAMFEGGDEIFTVSEWFYRQSGKTLDDVRDRTVSRVNTVTATSIEVETPARNFTVSRPEATSRDWTVKWDAREVPSDRRIIDRATATLSNTSFVSMFDAGTTTTTALGLDTPIVSVSVDGKPLLRLGRRVKGREQFYAQGADGNLGIVSAGPYVDFLRDPLEWSTKRLIWLDRDKIERVETSSGSAKASLLKDGDKWILVDSPGANVRQDAVEKFVDNALSVAAVQLVDPALKQDEWMKYGITDQTYRLVAADSEGTEQSFRLGSTTREGQSYALREADSSLWKIDFLSQKDIYKFRGDFIDRRINPDFRERIGRLVIDFGGKTFTLTKNDKTWSAQMPDTAAVTLPESAVAPFFDAFQNMEVESEMMGGKRTDPSATLYLYEAGAKDPYKTMELVTRGAFRIGNGLVHVSEEGFKPFDDALASLLLSIAAQGEADKNK